MYDSANGGGHNGGGAGRPVGVREHNSRMLSMAALSVVLMFFLASLYPQPLVMAVFSGLLTLGAMATCFMAALVGQRLFEPRMTLWDKSAILALLGLLTALAVDAETVRAFLEAQGATAVETAAPVEAVTTTSPHPR